jgi:hypothetical protein
MLDNVKLLTNVVSVNTFDVVDVRNIYSGSSPVPFHIQLFQSDCKDRYIPVGTVITVTVEFLRADTVAETPLSQTVVKTLAQTYGADSSIWNVDLIAADVANITTGGFRVTITEDAVITKIYSKMSIRKVASSDWPLLIEPTSSLVPTAPVDALWERILTTLYPIYVNDNVNLGSGNFITTGLVDGRDVSVDGATLDAHLNGGPWKHDASEIDVEGIYANIPGTPTDLETTIAAINTVIGNENLWDRLGTVLSPHTLGDSIEGASSIIPNAHNTADLGTDLLRYKDIYYAGTLYGGASPMKMESKEASGGTAFHLDTKNNFVAGDLLSLENATVAKLVVDFAGNITTVGTVDGIDVSTLPGAIAAKLDSADFTSVNVMAKLLTGFSSSAGALAAGDSLITGINKLDGNVAGTVIVANAALPAADFTSANVTAKVLGAGYSALAGVVTIGDTLEVAFEKLDGNVAATTIVANAALPKAGGQISGSITCAGAETFDGVDVSTLPGDISAKVAKAGDTMTGDLVMDNQKSIQFREADVGGDNYIGLKAPAALGGNVTFVLPTTDGGAGEFLKTDGSANLSFGAVVIPAQYWTRTLGVLSPTTITDDIDMLTGNVIKVDTINESTLNAGTTIEGVLVKDRQVNSDYVINEFTVDPGFEIAFMDTSEGVILLSGSYTYDNAETLANSLKIVMNAHAADGTVVPGEHNHGGAATPDIANFPITAPSATDFNSLRVLVDAIAVAYSWHNTDGVAAHPTYHNAQTPNYALGFIYPTETLYDCRQMLNEIKYRYNLHQANAVGHTTGGLHPEINADVIAYGFKSDTTGSWMNFMGTFFSPADDSAAQLGYYGNHWQALWLNNLGVDGGAIHFKGSFAGSSYLKATNTGLTLDIGGNFTKFEPFTTSVLSLGDATHAFKDVNLDNLAVDGGAIYFDAGTSKFLKSTADGTVLNVGGFGYFQPNSDVSMRLGDISHNFASLYLDFGGISGGEIFFNNGGSFLQSSSDGLTLTSSKFTSILPRLDMALDLASNIKAFYNAHIADAIPPGTDLHSAADGANVMTSNSGYDLTSLIAFITEALVDYAAHDLDATVVTPAVSQYHITDSGYAGNPLVSVVAPINLEECVTKLNDLRAKYQLHDASAVAHNTGLRYQVVSPAALFGEVSIGSISQPYKEFVGTKIKLDGGTVDGGALYFNSNTTSFFKSSIDGLTGYFGGFTNFDMGTANLTNIGLVDGKDVSTLGTGDVSGPGSSIDNQIARFDLATGKIIQTSAGVINDAGTLSGLPNTLQNVQDNIAVDGATLYFPLNDATPNISVKNLATTITLTKIGTGALASTDPFPFNANGKGVLFDGLTWLSGDTSLSIGTNDFIVEADAKINSSGTGHQCLFTTADAGGVYGAFVYIQSNSITLYLCDTGYAIKECVWSTSSSLFDGASHRYKFEVDRSNNANCKAYVDGILQTQTSCSLADYVALDLVGTFLHIGSRHVNVYTMEGTISSFKLLIGSLTSTTPAFKTTGVTIEDIQLKQGKIIVKNLGSITNPIQSLTLDRGALDGGAVYYNGGITSFLKSAADGLTLNHGGFSKYLYPDSSYIAVDTADGANGIVMQFSGSTMLFGRGYGMGGVPITLDFNTGQPWLEGLYQTYTRKLALQTTGLTDGGVIYFAAGAPAWTPSVYTLASTYDGKDLSVNGFNTFSINTAQKVKRTDASLAMAIATANALRTILLAHYADGAGHLHLGAATPDTVNGASLTAIPVASSLVTLITLITGEQDTYTLHDTDAKAVGGGSYHVAQYAGSDLTLGHPTTVATCIAALDELIVKYSTAVSSHDLDVVAHIPAHTHPITTALLYKYVTTPTDYFVAIYDTSKAVNVELTTVDMVSGRVIIVKDCSGAASVNNITVSTQGAEKIDFVDTVVISVNSGAVKVCADVLQWDTI